MAYVAHHLWILTILVSLLGCTSTPSITPTPTPLPPPQIEALPPNAVEVSTQPPNNVCVSRTNRDGRGSGMSCTSADADKPMLAMGGNAEEHHITVLDPSRQAVRLQILVRGTWYSIPLTLRAPEGNLIAAISSVSPDQIDILDEDGRIIQSTNPKAIEEQVQRDIEQQLNGRE